MNSLKSECSVCTWYPKFAKVSVESRILRIPEEVSKYLEHDAFVLPSEAVGEGVGNGEWTDGSAVDDSGVRYFFQIFRYCCVTVIGNIQTFPHCCVMMT